MNGFSNFNKNNRHKVHGGIKKETAGTPLICLDDYCEKNGIQQLNVVKIDTDGYEINVLKGAKKVIAKYQPTIIFELTNYLLEEKGVSFREYLNFFESLNYTILDNNYKQITYDNFKDSLSDTGSFVEL